MKRLLSSLVIGAVLLNAGMAAAAQTEGPSSVKVKKTHHHKLWKKKSAQATTASPAKSY